VDEKLAAPGWTLDELSSLAEARLSELGLLDAALDGRVAKAADPRTVRYYQSLGILDRPLSYEGHKARYGPRHLLQLLAVKLLQRERLPLADIQEKLYGRSDAELEALLGSAKTSPAKEETAKVPLSILREVTLMPGLKLVADERWAPGDDPDRLVAAFLAALAALQERD